MTGYRAPLRDMDFVLRHVVGIDELAGFEGWEHADPGVVMDLLADLACRRNAHHHDLGDRKSTRLNSSHSKQSRMPSSA